MGRRKEEGSDGVYGGTLSGGYLGNADVLRGWILRVDDGGERERSCLLRGRFCKSYMACY